MKRLLVLAVVCVMGLAACTHNHSATPAGDSSCACGSKKMAQCECDKCKSHDKSGCDCGKGHSCGKY
jgi:hypothetical protein